MERYLVLNNYRNIGINEKQKFKINSFMEKGSIGDLLLLLAQNNTGKSNVLDALKSVCYGMLQETDKPDFIYDSEISPNVKLYIKDEKIKYEFSVTTSGYNVILHDPDKKVELSKETLQVIINAIKGIDTNDRIRANYGNNNSFKHYCSSAQNKIESFTKLTDDEKSMLYILLDYSLDSNKSTEIVNQIELYDNQFNDDEKLIISSFKDKYGFNLIPKIVDYTSKNITQSSLNCYIKSISSSDFYQKLFKIIDVETNELQGVYENYRSNPVAHILRKHEDKLNEKLKRVSKDFNSAYCYEKDLYKFSIMLDKDTISFSIIQNNNVLKKSNKEAEELPLNLDRQSTGFKWFFDFYFDVLASNTLSKGDIVIMDEAVVHLHPSAIIEWRKLIKEFSKKSGITFVLASHNPFLTNLDHLDECRFLKKDGNEVVITNNFSLTCDGESKDVMLETLKALTVPMHVVFNPDNNLFFVEGITDYNYLVAFKELLKFDGINFMPFNGVKDKNLNQKLKSIIKKPFVLLDADKAGLQAKDRLSKDDDIEVHLLSDVGDSFTDIESLFEGDDKKYVKEKNIDNSVYFKKYITELKLNKKTINNFKKLFENIMM